MDGLNLITTYIFFKSTSTWISWYLKVRENCPNQHQHRLQQSKIKSANVCVSKMSMKYVTCFKMIISLETWPWPWPRTEQKHQSWTGCFDPLWQRFATEFVIVIIVSVIFFLTIHINLLKQLYIKSKLKYKFCLDSYSD